MTDASTIDLTADGTVTIILPDDETTSRLTPRTQPEESDDTDPVTANQRIIAFRRKYKDGRIVTHVVKRTKGGSFTVRAEVYTFSDSLRPDSTAHATRSIDDSDYITASRPQETAETAAVSRALRYLGVKIR